MEIYLWYFAVAMGFNIVMSGFAYYLQTDKLTDVSYSLTFMLLAIISLYHSACSSVDFILSAIVIVWALRLGIYLLVRIMDMEKDERFDNIRIDFFKNLGFWLLQGFSCFVIILPLIMIHQVQTDVIAWLFICGAVIAFLGIMLEAIADFQKFVFKRRHPDQFMKKGLWRIVQHPNYLGEILVWIGLFVSSIPYVSWYLAIVSPLWITLLLVFISGIPILQKKWAKKYGDDPEFRNYQSRTARLIPYLW